MRRLFVAVFAVLVAAFPLAAFAQEVAGRWSGSTDWPGTQYDSQSAWWEFRADGSFADNFGHGGSWSRTGATVTWRYAAGSRASYTGALSGGRLTGTMSDGTMNGSFALSAGAAAVTPVPVQAAPSQIDIEVCNRTGRAVLAAVIYRQMGSESWRSDGWYRVENNACRTIAATDNMTFYTYAEDAGGSGRFWGRGDLRHCVTRPGPYQEYISTTGVTCRSDQELVDFTAITAGGYGTYTWTLEP